MNKQQRIIFWVLLILCINLQAQPPNELGTPFIRNYKAEEYGANPQNWVVLQDKRGVMYFGNDQGVLEFDGKYWRLTPMPNHSIVRSMAMDQKGTIYVGAVGEFGYLAFNDTGTLTYVSLSNRLPKNDKEFRNVWRTLATTHGIYFEAEEKVFRFYKNTIDIIPMNIENFSSVVNDVVILKKRDEGFYLLKDGQPQLLPHTKTFPQSIVEIYVVMPYTDMKMLIATKNEGIYVYDLDLLMDYGSLISSFSKKDIPATVIQKFPTEIDGYLKYHEAYTGTKVNDDCYAFGTSTGGIVLMDQKGKLIQVINRNRGLNNDVLNYLYTDQHQNLWAALDNGISFIELSSPITQFNERSGLIDRILSITKHQGTLYVSNNFGVFYLPKYKINIKDDTYGFLPVKNASRDCWDFISVESSLLTGGRNVVFQIKDKTAKVMETEKFIYCFGRSEKFPDHIVLGLREGLAAFQLNPSRKMVKDSNDFLQVKYIDHGGFKKIKNIIRQITSDSKGDLWLTTYYKGLIYIRFTGSDISDFEIYRYNKSHGLPRDDMNRVYFINNRLLVASQSGIYEGILPEDFETDPTGVKFVPEETFGKLLPDPSTSVGQLNVDQNQKIWVNSGLGLGVFVKGQDGTYTWNGVPFNKIRGVSSSFFIEPTGIVWFPTRGALYRMDLARQKDYQSHFNTIIRKVRVSSDRSLFGGAYYDPDMKLGDVFTGSSLVQPKLLIPRLAYENNSLTFEYSTAFYEHAESNRFQYMLEGFDKDWSGWSAETKKEYTNLPPGSYCFKVKSRNIFDHESSVASYRFSISPPWYRTIYVYAGYGLMFLLVFFGGIQLNSRRLVAAKHRLEKIIKERTIELEESNIKLEEANLKLEKLATTDGLTGIANFRYFEEFYANEWRRCIRNGKPISVILTDVDFFKLFNDTYGHQMGDECLKRVAEVLDEAVNRPGDIVARYGGEEFVIVLSETDSIGANFIAEKIKAGVESLEMVHEESGISEYVTISAGCATTIPKKDMDSSSLINEADNALYQSKKNGRNRVTVVNYQSTI